MGVCRVLEVYICSTMLVGVVVVYLIWLWGLVYASFGISSRACIFLCICSLGMYWLMGLCWRVSVINSEVSWLLVWVLPFTAWLSLVWLPYFVTSWISLGGSISVHPSGSIGVCIAISFVGVRRGCLLGGCHMLVRGGYVGGIVGVTYSYMYFWHIHVGWGTGAEMVSGLAGCALIRTFTSDSCNMRTVDNLMMSVIWSAWNLWCGG